MNYRNNREPSRHGHSAVTQEPRGVSVPNILLEPSLFVKRVCEYGAAIFLI